MSDYSPVLGSAKKKFHLFQNSCVNVHVPAILVVQHNKNNSNKVSHFTGGGGGGGLFIFNATLEWVTFSFMEEGGLTGATFDEIHAFIHKVCALGVEKLFLKNKTNN